eukprot:Selendium_serpulae@DN3301_c0_g1_i1.p1
MGKRTRTANPSSSSSSTTAIKRRKGNDTSAPLVFDQSARVNYVTGFQQRNKDKREAAKAEQKAQERREARAASQAYKQQVIEQSSRLQKALAADPQWGSTVETFGDVLGRDVKAKKEGVKRRVTRMESKFYGEDATAVTVNIDFTTPAALRDPFTQKRPQKPESDIGKPEAKIKKQNVKRRYRQTPKSKLKISKRAKYSARFAAAKAAKLGA